MDDRVKEILARYDEIEALILEQKIDEFSDRMDEVPPDADSVTYDQYISLLAEDETKTATHELENTPDERLGGISLHDYFRKMEFEDLTECLEYCALELDRGVPESLIASLAENPDSDRVSSYCSSVIGNCAWTEEEMDSEDKLFEIEFAKVKACFEVLIAKGDASFVKAVLDKFMSYPITREFVAEAVADYIEAFPEVSVPFVIELMEANFDSGMTGPAEDLVIMITAMGQKAPSEEIYQALRHAFRYMENKIYAVICLADYGDKRAVDMFKNYINRNQKTISRDLFYEMMSGIQKLGGDISDIEDPFGDFTAKGNKAAGGK